ncbi:MAG: metallophosphoesterase [Prevotella sp.]|nr:metallophosphoesterase [Prevotella sp.]MCH3995601.1 metallophosphoesterase [Prevotella sp.]MCI1246223.1 metallophosphoesterase [Prevotella sp.]
MIARIFIWVILLITLPDLYLYFRYVRHRTQPIRWWIIWPWGIVSVGMIVYTVCLACVKNFIPNNFAWIELYLFLIGVLFNPKAIFSVCSFLGTLWCRLRHTRINQGNRVGAVLAGLSIFVFIYGLTIGPRKLKVTHVNLYFDDLPASFDGFKLVQFSDAHVGTFNRFMDHALKRDMDSIMAQKADMICFTGDLVNTRAAEIYPCQTVLAQLARKSGAPVYSILGNHDYSVYLAATPAERKRNELEIQHLERQMGWKLLKNDHAVIRRGNDSIVIAGEENGGSRKFPRKSNLRRTLKGVGKKAFIVMLQHDPTAWDDSIRPYSHTQLTLCGHTHAGQVEIFGLRPTQLVYREDYGLYEKVGRYLYVSSGLGGLIPFRFGATPEIVVVTLHRK